MTRFKHIVVIGFVNHLTLSRQETALTIDQYRGGVIGLQIACTLLKSGYKVTLVAKHLPGDTSIEYTSPWYAELTMKNHSLMFGVFLIDKTPGLVLSGGH